MMGENGTGKTTFCKTACWSPCNPDGNQKVPRMKVSMKPQKITTKVRGNRRQLFFKKIKTAFLSAAVPDRCRQALEARRLHRPGGEDSLRRRIATSRHRPRPWSARRYLSDRRASAYLDSEQRIIAARVIKRFIMHSKKTAFIVEHDFIMATYLADRVIVFDGQPGVNARAIPPSLCSLAATGSCKTSTSPSAVIQPTTDLVSTSSTLELDQEQKLAGNYVVDPLLIIMLLRIADNSGIQFFLEEETMPTTA